MNRFVHALALGGVVLVLGSCGSNTGSAGGPGVAGKAKLVNGATAVARGASVVVPSDSRVAQTWQVTPDTLTLKINKIGFLSATDPQNVSLTGCSATFDKTKAGLASLVDCDFTVPAGTYYGVFLYVDTTVTATINDTVGNFYTDGTGIVKTAPAGGAQASSFTYTGTPAYGADGFSSLSIFAQPLVVAADSAPAITVVIDGVHAIKVSVNGTTATFVGDGATVGHPDYVASANGVGKVAYYIDSALTYADAMTYTGSAFAKVFYTGDGNPTGLFYLMGGGGSACNGGTGQANNVSAANFQLNKTASDPNLKYGGYLGRDATAGRIKWARATSASWATYASVVTMDEKASLGQVTNMKCENTSTDPAPVGDTFSGTIADPVAPNATVALKLVAH